MNQIPSYIANSVFNVSNVQRDLVDALRMSAMKGNERLVIASVEEARRKLAKADTSLLRLLSQIQVESATQEAQE